MLKKILFVILFLVAGAYFAFAFFFSGKIGQQDNICNGIRLVEKDNANGGIISKEKIESILDEHKINPTGKETGTIDLDSIERVLDKHPLVKKTECYLTPDNVMTVEITQKIPVMRIMNNKGENFYIDHEGNIMPHLRNYLAYLPVATGYVSKEYASEQLPAIANFIKADPFWDGLIEQLDVNSSGEITIVPRVGSSTIILGKPENLEKKFDNLKTFYKKGLNVVGWNKYKTINIELDNQIIGVKK